MSYLLDTHVLVWWLYQPDKLSSEVKEILQDPGFAVYVSAISAYETANKFRLGKWDAIAYLANNFQKTVEDTGFRLLAVTADDAAKAALLSSEHRDPFDRIIAAQSVNGPHIVLTRDPKIRELNATVFW